MAFAISLSLCMIVRDSSRTLGDCLQSIRPWVDELVVVDTGSQDDTRKIAASFGAKVFDFAWCDDFSAARNESLKHASGDWLFWMDSDDTISAENGKKLRELAYRNDDTGPIAFVMQVHCPGPPDTCDVTVVDHVKMFRRNERIRFEGRIHEQILPSIRRIDGSVGWTDIYISHSGAEHSHAARKLKQERDLRLLELELAERPECSFVLFNLGMTYADMEQWHLSADYLKGCLLVSSPSESHVRKAYALLIGCLTQLNRDVEAIQFVSHAQELFSNDPELYFRRGILEQRAKNHDRAIAAYRRALVDNGERCFSSRDQGITGFKSRHNLASIYREVGRLDLAELQWRLVFAEQPTYRDGWRGLVATLLDQRKHSTLEVEIDAARADGFPPDEIVWAEARLAADRGNFALAIEILDGAISTGIEIIEPLRLKCQLLFEHFSVQEAIAALEELCRLCPTDGAAWHNLGMAHQRAGDNDLAVSCYEESLAKRPGADATMTRLLHARKLLGPCDSTQQVQIEPHEETICGAI